MNWSHFLITIRWQNIILIWLMQVVVYFQYVIPFCGSDHYYYISFLLFLASTGSIAGAGNIFNDIRDIKTDAIHPKKPSLVGEEIPLTTAWRWFYSLTGLSVFFVVSGWWIYQWPVSLITIFILGFGFLYLYSRYLKSTLLLGNILVALLCALSVWMTTLLAPDCHFYFSINGGEKIPLILAGYITNAFVITTLREVVKDKEDAAADMEAGIFTIGSIRNSFFRWFFNALVLISFVVNVFWFYLLYPLLSLSNWMLGVFMVFIPLAIIALIFNIPHKPNTYSFLSKLIKVYILLAILLLILWQR